MPVYFVHSHLLPWLFLLKLNLTGEGKSSELMFLPCPLLYSMISRLLATSPNDILQPLSLLKSLPAATVQPVAVKGEAMPYPHRRSSHVLG